MPKVTIAFGAALLAVAAFGYFGSEGKGSLTAIIPAAFGLPLAAAGLLALKDSWRKHAMHVAAGIGLLGLLLAGSRVAMVLAKGEITNQRAIFMVGTMTLLCAVFVALCVWSFVAARLRQAKA